MAKRVFTWIVLLTFCATSTFSCSPKFADKWDNFIRIACDRYEEFHPKIENGLNTLQDVLNLIVSGWPESATEVAGFILAAQIVIAGLTKVLSFIAKTCPEKADVEATEKICRQVLVSPVVQMAMKQAKINIARKATKK